MTALLDLDNLHAVLFLGLIGVAILGAVWIAFAIHRRNGTLRNELLHLEEKIRQRAVAAQHDSLTGLLNRRTLARHFKASAGFATRAGHSIVVCYIDLDGFKRVNTRHGIHIGDQVLVRLANRLRRSLRSGDVIARISGDQFVVLLDGVVDPDDCTRAVGKMLREASRSFCFEADRRRVTISASIGMSIFPTHGTELPALFACAWQALVEARRGGPGRFALYTRKTAAAALAARAASALDEASMLALPDAPYIDLHDASSTGGGTMSTERAA